MRVLLALAVTASAAAAGLAYSGTPNSAEVLVTRDSLSLPARCSPRQVAAVAQEFLQAINEGLEARLQRLLARPGSKPPAFQWVTDGQFAAYTPVDAVRYLLNYHERGERIQLRQLSVGRSWVAQSVGVGFVLTRTAKDLRAQPTMAHGKAEIHCRTKTIYVWSMGADTASFCPVPPSWGPTSAPVACTRSGRPPTAPEIAPSYRSTSSSLKFAAGCAPGAVEERLLRSLRALNIGNGAAFARGFRRRLGPSAGLFLRERRYTSRSALTEYASQRNEAEVGWTLLVLNPPSVPDGPYRLLMRVGGRGQAPIDSGGQVLVDCRTGLIRRLVLRSVGA